LLARPEKFSRNITGEKEIVQERRVKAISTSATKLKKEELFFLCRCYAINFRNSVKVKTGGIGEKGECPRSPERGNNEGSGSLQEIGKNNHTFQISVFAVS